MDKNLKIQSLNQQFEKAGIDKSILEIEVRKNYKISDALINGENSPLVNLNLDLNGTKIAFNGKIGASFKGDEASIRLASVQKQLVLPNQYFGHTFTDEQKNRLNSLGHMGEIAQMGERKAFISVDKDTNRISTMSADKFNVPETVASVKLSEQQSIQLKNGKPIYLENMVNSKGENFSSFLQVDASNKKLSFFQADEKQRQLIEKIPDLDVHTLKALKEKPSTAKTVAEHTNSIASVLKADPTASKTVSAIDGISRIKEDGTKKSLNEMKAEKLSQEKAKSETQGEEKKNSLKV